MAQNRAGNHSLDSQIQWGYLGAGVHPGLFGAPGAAFQKLVVS